jgi:S-adenosylmethionine synthetase
MSDEISPSVIAAISKTDPNSRVAFQRRLSNLENYITNEVNPIEEQIIHLKAKLIPLYDAVKILRDDAREHCTHTDLARQEDGSIKCKFCDTIFHVNE